MTRVAIVTASDSGIGKTTALMLAERGFDIGVTWHSDESGARETCREVEARGQRAEAIHLDLSTLPEGAEAIETLIARFGRLDVFCRRSLICHLTTGGRFSPSTWTARFSVHKLPRGRW